MASFEAVADEYDAARPSYPDDVFDALEPLAGLRVLDVGAGTGIAAVDLVCFAQAWHWLNPATRLDESHRVLRPGGRWAGWWSHARADGQQWFDDHWAAVERTCPGTHRGQRDTDWGATIVDGRGFDVHARMTIPWIRELTIDTWMTDLASHSYIVGLPNDDRDRLLTNLRQIARAEFRDGPMVVPYETWLWIASRI